jgi:hypothetical protein
MILNSVAQPFRFNRLLERLLVADVAKELRSIDGGAALTLEDLTYLLSSATRLALSSSGHTSNSVENCRLAYEIAVRAPHLGNGSGGALASVSDLILTRLGNFPARALMRQEFESNTLRDPWLDMEVRLREQENYADGITESALLTNFQTRLIDALEEKSYVSVSAPTSAGKSFTLELELLQKLRKNTLYTAIYLVPTRALIRQVSLDLTDLVRSNSLSALVLSSPVVPANSSRQLIFVLTQERFAALIAEAPSTFNIDAIVVDEAQEIGKDSRGMTLERVLRLALRRFPKTRLFFSSPLRSNPEFLLNLFGKAGSDSSHFIEEVSPVTQNLISITPVVGSPRNVKLSLTVDKDAIAIRTVELPFALRKRYMGKVAHHFTRPGDSSIIYTNRPSEAYKTANEIAELLDDNEDEDLADFSTFLRQEVHRLYRLSGLVKKGVAFHYANLPQIVRGKIEDLLKSRKIQFVCCTSTLLQGMNLPAKNLFLENPKTGQGADGEMSTGDFWNLVGRAGRLGKEFTGNVFSVFGKGWDNDLLMSDRLVDIESAYNVAIHERTAELAFYAESLQDSPDANQAWAEHALASIYADNVLYDQQLKSIVTDESLRDQVARIDKIFAELKEKQTLSDDTFLRNLYVHPQRLEDLAIFLREQEDIFQWLPLIPFADPGAARLTKIFQALEETLIKSSSLRYKYFGFLGSRWMQGISLRELITDRLEYRNIPDKEKEVNSEIADLFEEIEKTLRFVYVKYMGIYTQILKTILLERGMEAQAEKVLPIHVFLEFGAATPTLINLMSIGVSRTSALLLKSAASLNDDLDAARCKVYIESVNLTRATLPAICKSEIRRLRGRA